MDRNEIDGRMSRMDAATLRPTPLRAAVLKIPHLKPGERLEFGQPNLNTRCTVIADAVVPEYRLGGKERSCTGHWAKRWSAAYSAAEMALKGEG